MDESKRHYAEWKEARPLKNTYCINSFIRHSRKSKIIGYETGQRSQLKMEQQRKFASQMALSGKSPPGHSIPGFHPYGEGLWRSGHKPTPVFLFENPNG